MAVNKVVYNQNTLIDLTSDTVTAETLKKGYTAHKADSKGQKLIKDFASDLKKCEAVLTDAAGVELARLTKIFSDDGKQIESVVVYK